ncbi:MAG: hypothetical protein KJ638_10170 [Chloroflexi bacterium]|nr:hypothetical protein [Chloroflexota bacterium]
MKCGYEGQSQPRCDFNRYYGDCKSQQQGHEACLRRLVKLLAADYSGVADFVHANRTPPLIRYTPLPNWEQSHTFWRGYNRINIPVHEGGLCAFR